MDLEDKNESADLFLRRMKELEIKSTQEDFDRSQRLQSELSSVRSSIITLPRPVGRQDSPLFPSDQSFTSKYDTESTKDLAYQSAYNYEKTFRNTQYTSSIDKENYSVAQKIPNNMPEVIRFDDFVTSKNVRPQNSKYLQFQITEERKQEIDNTIKSLVDDEKYQGLKPLTREHKGGYISNSWISDASTKPKLDVPANIKPLSERTQDIKKSPKKNNLSQSLHSAPKVESNSIKRSPGKIRITEVVADAQVISKSKPEIKPKPQTIALKTQIQTQPQKSWIDSVRNKEPKQIPQESTNRSPLYAQSNSMSFVDSVKKNTHVPSESQLFDTINPKIKIANNLNSSLKKNISEFEELEKERTSTLKELNDTKLSHVKQSPRPSAKVTSNEDFQPIVLKKVRPSIPQKRQEISLGVLVSDKNQPSLDQRKTTEPEALKRSKNLKPPLPQRKPSLEIPEALKKSKSLKTPVPKEKPQLEVIEAVEVLNKLQPAKTRVVSKEPLPEAMKQLHSLKPGKPIRKPTPSELEAISRLKNIKTKSNGSPPIVLPKSSRVTSQSKQILNTQLSKLKSVRETNTPLEPKTELMKTLEKQLLRKAHTESDILSSKAKSDNSEIRRSKTFDEVDTSVKKLDHITNLRTKGPKRRAPKSVK